MKFDIIGDIHGCFLELTRLFERLGYRWQENIPVHPNGRIPVFLGDLTDRGPASLAVIELVHALIMKNMAYYAPGNHCNKLYRFFLGRKVKIANGLETTVVEYDLLPPGRKNESVISLWNCTNPPPFICFSTTASSLLPTPASGRIISANIMRR